MEVRIIYYTFIVLVIGYIIVQVISEIIKESL